MFVDRRHIENWGSGVKRYIDAIKGMGLREPEFVVWPNAVRVNVYRHKETSTAVEPNEPKHEPNEPNREPNEPNGGLAARVLGLLSESPEITIGNLTNACGVSRETVKRTLKILKDDGCIRRIGRTRGHWEIVSGKWKRSPDRFSRVFVNYRNRFNLKR